MTVRVPAEFLTAAVPTRSASKVLIFVNPTAGRGLQRAKLDELISKLRSHGLDPECTESRDELMRRLQDGEPESQFRALVAMGGDGTVAAAVELADGRVPIVPLPAGTENLFARHFGFRCDPDEIVAIITEGNAVRIDVGRANGRLFLNMLSAGYDAEVVRQVHAGRTGTISRWDYARPIMSSLGSYRFPKMTVRFTDLLEEPTEVLTVATQWAFVFNLNCYARGMQLAPRAVANDGRLDLTLFHTPHALWGIVHWLTVLARRHGSWSGCRHYQCATLVIDADDPVPYQMDGDFGGMLPVAIEVLPSHSQILLPQTKKSYP